jgi:Fic family protein
MNSVAKEYLDELKFDSGHIATLRGLGECKGRQELYTRQSPEALETLRSLAIIESTESSNRLEGIIATRERIESIVLKSAAPRNRSEQEIAGYRDALALIHESWKGIRFDNTMIKQLHKMLYRYLPEQGGNWKTEDNVIWEKYSDGTRRVRFEPTPAKDTPAAMERLIKRYKMAINDGRDPIVVIPLTIFDFLCIHPFRDGNGRMARLLTLLLLYQHGYIVGKYIGLERLFEETKRSYYETLRSSSKYWHEGKHDIMPWLTYFWGVLLRAYKEFSERVGTITTGRGAKTEQITLTIQRKIVPFSVSDIERECPGISRDMIRFVIHRLRDDGIIKSTGIGRNAKWVKT